MKKRKAIILTVVILAAILSAGGCFKRFVEEREPLPEIAWPTAPEMPRIRFVNSISKPEDLQIRAGMFKRFFEYLFGKPERSIVAPYGVETDSSGRLYIVDTFLRTVHVFDVQANKYHTFSTNKTTLESPIDIAIDHERGYIYVTDSKGGSVKIFKDMGKEFVGEIG